MQDIQMTPRKLQSIMNSSQPIPIFDIRENWERELAYIPNSVHIPLSNIQDRLEELPKDRYFAVVCHHGIRSLKTVLWLRQNGLEACNLIGGINSWSEEIDPSVPKY